jgi:hypothetical protein
LKSTATTEHVVPTRYGFRWNYLRRRGFRPPPLSELPSTS